ncbi:protein of unknown function UPF0153 [Allomeiothermus silvanus DSM 9946]|uniref:YkgJ family cysteine cluster protein n=1 Tax=Allomeiothermus silvanus (strain ATCC 700542 / DSM 9946 / NBRC 106475 / NCIMB 13440 / VI-R2) TaxID=526227 RepID=D7BHP9_ALLS1|nr:YkgJ family cysteine cluster protein [Allomeiothermus silvanus]ADH63989.1 protein of unknown function UPF0153 [Allomeiothermus silvanus DSM 9946]
MKKDLTTYLSEAVQSAHDQLERRIAAYLAGKELGISCRKGCAFCCHALVTLSLAEAEYLRGHLSPEGLEHVQGVGQKRLQRIAREKNTPDFPTRYFLEAHPCPLLTQDGACSAYAHRPLACRGVLTDLQARYCSPGAIPALKGTQRKAYLGQLEPHHGPEHYLKIPWRASEQAARRLWRREQGARGFTVIGELASMIYLLGQADFRKALSGGQKAVRDYLRSQGLLGGEWGFWVG